MTLTPVACHKCGAPLEVPNEARFVTCRHCGIQLEVKHNDSATWTEQIEEIQEQTEELVEQVAQLQYQNALQAIDRDWDRERESLLITHSKSGRRTEPNVAAAIFGICTVVVIGLIVAVSVEPGFGVLIVLIGIVAGMFNLSKAQQFETAKRRHRQRKAGLQINHFRSQAATGKSPSPSGPATFESWGKDT